VQIRRVPTDWYYSVYAIGSGKAVKVGYARNVARRLAELQTGSPEELIIWTTLTRLTRKEAQEIERRAHKALADCRTRGEWFKADLDAVYNALWQAMDKRVYSARQVSTFDLRGHASLEQWGSIIETAFKDVTNAKTIQEGA
jgi:hypothetical protein